MKNFINRRLYTDIESWVITNLDEVKGTATAQSVIKVLPKVEGGRPLYGEEDYDKIQPSLNPGSAPFKIFRRKDGKWGFWRESCIASLPVDSLMEEGKNSLLAQGGLIEDGRINFYKMTASGKRAQTFEVLGRICDVCRYYYDHSF